MTTIAGIQGDGFVVVGSDTRISSLSTDGGAYQYSQLGNGSSKISARGKYLLGAAGDVRAINILHHVFQPPAAPINLRGKKLDTFITSKVIPALRECFDKQGYSTTEPSGKETRVTHSSTVVIVVNANIYFVEEDYSWTSEASGLYACGTGSSYALGALHALTNGKTDLSIQQAKRVVLKALSTAAKFDPYTSGPYHTFMQALEKK